MNKIILPFLLCLLPLTSTANPNTNTNILQYTDNVDYCIPQGPRIALTFDDGPRIGQTKEILDILYRHNQVATFFLVGNMAKHNPDIVMDIYNHGHEIAVHTEHHYNLLNLDLISQEEEIESGYYSILNIVPDAKISYWRAPYGALPRPIPQITKSLQLEHVLWTIDTNDWQNPGASAVYDIVTTKAKDRAIVLMHDFTPDTRQSLESIIVNLTSRGFILVTMSDLNAPTCQNTLYASNEGVIEDTNIKNAQEDVDIVILQDNTSIIYKGPTLEDYNKKYGTVN